VNVMIDPSICSFILLCKDFVLHVFLPLCQFSQRKLTIKGKVKTNEGFY
jgi:hypothetical protein